MTRVAIARRRRDFSQASLARCLVFHVDARGRGHAAVAPVSSLHLLGTDSQESPSRAAPADDAAPLVGAGRRLALLAVGTRRDAGPLAKRVTERSLRRVARQVRRLRERCAIAQQDRRLLHSETR